MVSTLGILWDTYSPKCLQYSKIHQELLQEIVISDFELFLVGDDEIYSSMWHDPASVDVVILQVDESGNEMARHVYFEAIDC